MRLMAWAPTLGWLFLGRAIAGAAGAVYRPGRIGDRRRHPARKARARVRADRRVLRDRLHHRPGDRRAARGSGRARRSLPPPCWRWPMPTRCILFMPETLKPREPPAVPPARRAHHRRVPAAVPRGQRRAAVARLVPLAARRTWSIRRLGRSGRRSGSAGTPRRSAGASRSSGSIMACVQGGLTGPVIKRIGERKAIDRRDVFGGDRLLPVRRSRRQGGRPMC